LDELDEKLTEHTAGQDMYCRGLSRTRYASCRASPESMWWFAGTWFGGRRSLGRSAYLHGPKTNHRTDTKEVNKEWLFPLKRSLFYILYYIILYYIILYYIILYYAFHIYFNRCITTQVLSIRVHPELLAWPRRSTAHGTIH
jgi:hypothetical protein